MTVNVLSPIMDDAILGHYFATFAITSISGVILYKYAKFLSLGYSLRLYTWETLIVRLNYSLCHSELSMQLLIHIIYLHALGLVDVNLFKKTSIVS
jgi:hypothetical protein